MALFAIGVLAGVSFAAKSRGGQAMLFSWHRPPKPPPPPPTPPPPPPVGGQVLFSDSFTRADGLITNEYAYWNPNSSTAVKSPDWEMGSGSLFASANSAWTGVPDAVDPNAGSTNGTDSAIFRLTTKRKDFGDVVVSFVLYNKVLSSTTATPKVAWDGVHIFLRYQSETNLYYASINRRDETAVIKKKVTGGPDNGGTYYELTSYVSHPVAYNTWQQIKATIKTNADGSVTIRLYSGDQLVVEGIDKGIGGPPITKPGATGLRGDNDNFLFDDFTVTSI